MEEKASFIPYEHSYLKIKQVKNRTTGEVIEFTFATKFLYRYMWDRYNFFKQTGKKYFDNQAELAVAIGATPRTVINCVESLVKVGLVTKTQTKAGRGMHSNCYDMLSVFDDSVFDVGSCGEFFLKPKKKSLGGVGVHTKNISSKNPCVPPKASYKRYDSLIDNLPF